MTRPICELYGTEMIPRRCRYDCGYADYDDEGEFFCAYTHDDDDDWPEDEASGETGEYDYENED